MKHNTSTAVRPGRGEELSFPSRYGTVRVFKTSYASNGAFAVELVFGDSEVYTILSVNMPDHTHLLQKGEFFAKTWSENEEFAADALASGIFRNTGRTSGDDTNAQIWQFK